MDKYVKLADLENYAKIAKTIGIPTDSFLNFARNHSTDYNVAEVIRCENCKHSSEREGLSYICKKYSPFFTMRVDPKDFCSRAKPKV